jgi:hypothetical protein
LRRQLPSRAGPRQVPRCQELGGERPPRGFRTSSVYRAHFPWRRQHVRTSTSMAFKT